MKILIAAYYEFLKNLRDIKIGVILLLFPIITVYLLGNAVGSYFLNDIEKIPVGYVNEDKGVIGTEFDKFLHNKEFADKLGIINYPSQEEGEKAINAGLVDAVVYLPSNLSEEVTKGTKQSIILSGKKNVELLESITSGFISSYNSLQAVISVSGNPEFTRYTDSVKRIFYTKDATIPDMMDYYSVLTLLQTLILGGIFGVFIVTKSADSDMHIRINSLPVSRWQLIIGRVIGSTLYLLLAAIIYIFVAKYLYHANWSGDILIILGALLAFCVIAVGIGILIGLLVPSFTTALMILLLIMMIFGTVSGSVTPINSSDIGIITPNYHAKILLFGTIYGYSKQVMLESALWLAGLIAVIYGFSAFILRMVKYDNI